MAKELNPRWNPAKLYLQHAGASPMAESVFRKYMAYTVAEQTLGGYRAGTAYEGDFQRFYVLAGQLVGAQAQDMCFIESSTRGLNLLLQSYPWQPGDALLTGKSDYEDNLYAYHSLKQRFGIEVRCAPVNQRGEIELAGLDQFDDGKIKVFSFNHIYTNLGIVQPVEPLIQWSQQRGIHVVVDACQSAGQYPLDVKKWGCDALVTSGRKYLRGPRGTGLMFVAPSFRRKLSPPYVGSEWADIPAVGGVRWRDTTRVFELYERSYAAQYGLACALDYALNQGIQNIRDTILERAQQLRQLLADTSGVHLQEDAAAELSGIVTFGLKDSKVGAVMKELEAVGTVVGAVAKFGQNRTDAKDWVMRASVHSSTTEAELQQFAQQLQGLLS